jgi:hypothetical protein
MNQSMHLEDARFYTIPDSRNMIAQYFLLYSNSGNSSDLDRLIDMNYQRGVITVITKNDSYKNTHKIMDFIAHYAKQHLTPKGIKISFGGNLAEQLAVSQTVINAKLLNILQVSGIIFLISSLIFSSWLAGLLVILPLLLTVVLNLAVMGITGITLNVATASISALAMSMGADYGIYYLCRWREELSSSENWLETFKKTEVSSGKAILYVATAITSGYASITLSGFSIHLYVGILVPLTMAISSVSALTFLPALVLRLKPKFLRCQING